MKRGFTLIEMLITVAVIVILMTMMFVLSSIGGDSEKRTITIVKMQRLENCLSGYYAVFGSYPPVKRHVSVSLDSEVDAHGINNGRTSELNWGDNDEVLNRINAVCRSQPVAMRYPYNAEEMAIIIREISDEMARRAASGDELYKKYWENEEIKNKLLAKFDCLDTGSTEGRFDENQKRSSEWNDIQLFKFGLMSFLLPRYLLMTKMSKEVGGNLNDTGYEFAQWTSNNTLFCDPFLGTRAASWKDALSFDEEKLANVPSQSACRRWLPNLEGICSVNSYYEQQYRVFGVSLADKLGGGGADLSVDNVYIELFSPDGAGSTTDQYVLDGITVKDGWGREFYYYSPEPYQNYTLWSAGPDGKTFPPWIRKDTLPANARKIAVEWTEDDIIQLKN